MSERVMVLNKNYEFLNYVGWQKALSLVVSEKAEIMHETDKKIRTVYVEFKVPSIIRLLFSGVRNKKQPKFSRINVLKRDGFKCQYCGRVLSRHSLTLDHVLPRSFGGKTSWENIATSCKRCNSKKENKTPEQAGMKLLKKPVEPSYPPIVFTIETIRPEWINFLRATPGFKIVGVAED